MNLIQLVYGWSSRWMSRKEKESSCCHPPKYLNKSCWLPWFLRLVISPYPELLAPASPTITFYLCCSIQLAAFIVSFALAVRSASIRSVA